MFIWIIHRADEVVDKHLQAASSPLKHLEVFVQEKSSSDWTVYISEKHAVLHPEFALPTSQRIGDWSPGCPNPLEIPPWSTELHIPHPQPWTHSNMPTAIKFRADFKIHLPTYKAFCVLAASYLNEFMAPRHLTRVLRSQNLWCRHSFFV